MPKQNLCYSDCEFLNITEAEQKLAPHVEHYCKKYNKRVYHRNVHPHLLRVEGCTYKRSVFKKDSIATNVLTSTESNCNECRFGKSRGCVFKLIPKTCNSFRQKVIKKQKK